MYETVIGLEVHLALSTDSKMFCSCPAESQKNDANTATCPVCLGLPGSLPTINENAVEKGIMFSLALDCQVPELTQFHRKHYYYPDQPKNYQISQYDRPVGEHGSIELSNGRTIGITRCHLEEDAGRLVHPSYVDYSLVDVNRAGTALIEMVTEPELESSEEAREFLRKIRAIAQALGISDANPEEGKMRADVNISLRKAGQELGTKVEIKNLNSFKSVQRSIEFEIKRQSRILEEGGKIRQDTMGWDDGGQKTYLMRTKEGEADYSYMPEPDLPPLKISKSQIEQIKAKTPELPDSKLARYLAENIREQDAKQIAVDVYQSKFFDAVNSSYSGNAQTIANWLTGDIAGYLNNNQLKIQDTKLSPQNLTALLDLIDNKAISGKVAKDILEDVINGQDPAKIVEEKGLGQISDDSAIIAIAQKVIDDNPELVERVRANPKAINALLGLVMRESKGKANPELVRKTLQDILG